MNSSASWLIITYNISLDPCLFIFHLLQEPESIDWEYYRKGIGSRLVDMYKEHYESMFSELCD